MLCNDGSSCLGVLNQVKVIIVKSCLVPCWAVRPVWVNSTLVGVINIELNHDHGRLFFRCKSLQSVDFPLLLCKRFPETNVDTTRVYS